MKRLNGAVAVGVGPPSIRNRVLELVENAGLTVDSRPRAGGVIVLPDRPTELERLRTIRTTAEACPDCPILAIVATETLNPPLRRVLLAGAAGIVRESELERALVVTVQAMAAGQLTVPLVLGRQIAPRPLSHREKQVLREVVLGYTNREIAQRLFLAESTVKTHISAAFRKIDAHSRSEAVARIMDPESGYGVGILDLPDEPLAAAG